MAALTSMGSSSSSAGTSSTTGRSRSTTWSWWDEVDAGVPLRGGGARPWKCKLCPYARTSGADKVRAHLLHEEGKEVRFCTNVSIEKRQELLDRIATSMGNSHARRTPNIAVDPTTWTPRPAGHGASCRRPPGLVATQPSRGPSMATGRGAKQSSLHTSWEPKKKEETDAAVARFFYHDHIAFKSARSPYFLNMVTKIAEYGPTYKPPSSETIRTTLLQKEKVAIEIATANIRNQWARNGVTLIADGWSDTRHRSIHGVVAYSRGDVYFIGSHDASETGKSADVLASEWCEAVQAVGAENVVQFVADGEPTNRAAGNILMAMYPHITFSPCMAHCLNNLLKDIGDLPWIASLVAKGNKIITFICNHQYLHAEFRKRSDKELLKYSDTRFAYNFLMLGRLHYCKGAIRELFASDEYENWTGAATATAVLCNAYVSDRDFWDEVNRTNQMVDPIMHMLRLADGMDPCIGKIYEGMDRMIERLESLEPNADRYEQIKELCISRWNEYDSPMHAAAYVLDPEFQGKMQERDLEVVKAWNTLLARLYPSREMQRKIKNQLSVYRQTLGMFGTEDALEDRTNIGAALWWEDYGAEAPELQSLAIRILSQTISSSCLEQLWSSFNHIHSKKRNRLGTMKTNDLVYVSSNLRLLARISVAKADSFICWEKDDDDDDGDDDGQDVVQQDEHSGTVEPSSMNQST